MSMTRSYFTVAAAAVLLLVAHVAAGFTPSRLTLHNLCPYPIWPVIQPSLPSLPYNPKLNPSGAGLLTVPFPDAFWSGRIVPRTGCPPSGSSSCQTGAATPFTVVQISIHDSADHVVYSVSLVDGFNVPVAISPQEVSGGQCPVLGCAVDLNKVCPRDKSVFGTNGRVIACQSSPALFKANCPDTRTTSSDKEQRPQNCPTPGEVKVIFCPTSTINEPLLKPEVTRTFLAAE